MNRFADIDCSFKRLPPVYGFRVQKLVSLEEALQTIEAQIDQLPYFIKMAKKSCFYPNPRGLSKDQAASIYIYTMEWGETTLYRVLNQALRAENRQALKIWFPYLKLFDTALDLLPTVKEVVWRGVPLDIGKNFTKNQSFTWWTVNSCSSSVDIIEQFLHNKNDATLFLIEAINGKKVLGYTEYESEDEIILKIGTEFRVKANPLKRPDGSHTVHLIEIDGKDEDEDEADKHQSVTTAMKSFNVTPKSSNKQTSSNQTNSHADHQLKLNLQWLQDAQTIAGGNGCGDQSNQFNSPSGIYVDNQQQCIYVADRGNKCIVQWKLGEDNGQIVAGGNQLDRPTDVTVDQKNKSLIICDHGNGRVVRSSLENLQEIEILINYIDCYGLMMNDNGDLFVSDFEEHDVKRWRKGEKEGTVVAGGNGCGKQLNQLNQPRFIFVDRQETVYVSDGKNHRVMKWMKDAEEGVIVAGGHGQGNSFRQLAYPEGLIVNDAGDVYVADYENNRIMCWPSGAREGLVVAGGNDWGQRSDQFKFPIGLSLDAENNLYVVDQWNYRIQRFEIDQK